MVNQNNSFISTDEKRLVSIIIPAFNEEENIPLVRKELLSVINHLPYGFEFIFVDNNSTDRTAELVKEICAEDRRWKYIRFSRNFTTEMSITAGYHFAHGNAIIVLYSDLQDPPEVIPRFLEKWEEGYDIVYGVRTVRPGEPKWRNFVIKCVYKLIAWFSDVPIPVNAGDFRLISRQVRDALGQCPEYNRYMRGLIAWLGFNQIGVEYERRPRVAGQSKAPFWDLVLFTLGAISSFSLKPLRIFTFMGFSILAICSVALPVYVSGYFWGSPPKGTTTIIGLLIIGIGLNSLGIGILGEYLGRTYVEVKRRPLYLIKETMNINTEKKAHV